jgi:hypothetical protein
LLFGNHFFLNRFNLAEKEGEADRKVPLQPLVFVGKDGKVSRYNLRKVKRRKFRAMQI